jgi:hypothetical protein
MRRRSSNRRSTRQRVLAACRSSAASTTYVTANTHGYHERYEKQIRLPSLLAGGSAREVARSRLRGAAAPRAESGGAEARRGDARGSGQVGEDSEGGTRSGRREDAEGQREKARRLASAPSGAGSKRAFCLRRSGSFPLGRRRRRRRSPGSRAFYGAGGAREDRSARGPLPRSGCDALGTVALRPHAPAGHR